MHTRSNIVNVGVVLSEVMLGLKVTKLDGSRWKLWDFETESEVEKDQQDSRCVRCFWAA